MYTYMYHGAIISDNPDTIAWCRKRHWGPNLGLSEIVINVAFMYCKYDTIDKVVQRYDNEMVESVCCSGWSAIRPRMILYIHTKHDIHFGEYIHKLVYKRRFDMLDWLLSKGLANCATCEERTCQKIYGYVGARYRRTYSDSLDQYFKSIEKYKTVATVNGP